MDHVTVSEKVTRAAEEAISQRAEVEAMASSFISVAVAHNATVETAERALDLAKSLMRARATVR